MKIERMLSITALTLVVGSVGVLASCHRHDEAPLPANASSSATVIGTNPAPPTGNTPGTTPVASNTTDVTKAEETGAKPQEGDNHSHSTLAPVTKQKADGVNRTGK